MFLKKFSNLRATKIINLYFHLSPHFCYDHIKAQGQKSVFVYVAKITAAIEGVAVRPVRVTPDKVKKA
jgi:hypothetical protein